MKPKNKIKGQFSARTIEMMESPAFHALNIHEHRILFRLEIEHAHHGGNDNGRLPVTYDQFVEGGIRRHSIKPSLRAVVALGFVEITEHGRAGNAEWRRPNYFRLTYRYLGRAKPTDEWQHIKTKEQAQAIAEHARGEKPAPKNKTPVTFSSGFQCQNRHQETPFHSVKTVTTTHSAESVTTSIFLEGVQPAKWVPCAGQNLAHLKHSHCGAMTRVANPVDDRLEHLRIQRWSAPELASDDTGQEESRYDYAERGV
jgi:hypothetical protein